MPADTAPADSLVVIDFEEFKCGATVRPTERPSHFPHSGCVLDVSDAKVLRPRDSVGAAGGDVLIVRIIDLADRRLKERLLAIA